MLLLATCKTRSREHGPRAGETGRGGGAAGVPCRLRSAGGGGVRGRGYGAESTSLQWVPHVLNEHAQTHTHTHSAGPGPSSWWKNLITFFERNPQVGWAYWALNGAKWQNASQVWEDEAFGILEMDYRTARHSWMLAGVSTLASLVEASYLY